MMMIDYLYTPFSRLSVVDSIGEECILTKGQNLLTLEAIDDLVEMIIVARPKS